MLAPGRDRVQASDEDGEQRLLLLADPFLLTALQIHRCLTAKMRGFVLCSHLGYFRLAWLGDC